MSIEHPSTDTVTAYYPTIHRYAQRLLRDPILAEDVVQEVFTRYEASGRDVPRDRLRAWLYRVARNLVIDMIRKSRGPVGTVDPDLLPGAAARYEPSLLVEKKEAVAMLLQKLNELPPRQREVVRLKFQEGLSYAEIANVTHQTRATVGWLLHEAMKRLRDAMLRGDRA